ncbi:MAG: three-helix bundle dimerization domain-containing protein [Acidimicrobiia bacterium]
MHRLTEDQEVEVLAARLQRELSDHPPDIGDVRREVRQAFDRYRDARVRRFVPTLVWRDARANLRVRRVREPSPT